MAKIYGSTIGSTFQAYMDYELIDKGAQMLVKINELGIYVLNKTTTYTFGGLAHSSDRITYKIGTTPVRVSARSVGKGEHFNLLTTSHQSVYFPKTTSASEGVCVGNISIPIWNRVSNSGATELQVAVDTRVELRFTIPALTKPVASITATRDADTPTTLGISVTVNSFKDDEISSITVVDGNGNPLGSTSSTIVIPTSGQIVQPFVTQGVTTGSIVAKVVVIGLGGASAEASVVIPVAFFTMDVQRGGKEIAFGSSAIDSDAQASEHGIFNCFMEAKFRNGLSTESPLFRTETTYTASRSWSAKGTALAQFNYKPDEIEGYTPIALVGANSGNTNVTVSAHYNGSVVAGHAYNHNASAVSTGLRLRFLYVANGLV